MSRPTFRRAVYCAPGAGSSGPIIFTAVAAFSRWYTGDVDLSDPPPGMAPERAKNLASLPPAYVGTAGHDPLRDGGARYAKLLDDAGVPVQLSNEPTMVHAFVSYAPFVPAAAEAANRGLAALKTALAKGARGGSNPREHRML